MDKQSRNYVTAYVYVLGTVDDKYYIGQTININRRMWEHFNRQPKNRFLISHNPKKIISITEVINRDKALELEYTTIQDYKKLYGYNNVGGC